MIFNAPNEPPLGTGFSMCQGGLVFTAAHIVEGRNSVIVVNTYGPKLRLLRARRIILHPEADVAAILLPGGGWPDNEWFKTVRPSPGYKDFPLGTEVGSYGYPSLGVEKPIPPRYMRGHIQRAFECRDEGYRYQAFELGFPAFPGQSGSPIFLDDPGYIGDCRNRAIGVVTRWVVFETEHGEERSSVRWATCATLTSLMGWVEEVQEGAQ